MKLSFSIAAVALLLAGCTGQDFRAGVVVEKKHEPAALWWQRDCVRRHIIDGVPSCAEYADRLHSTPATWTLTITNCTFEKWVTLRQHCQQATFDVSEQLYEVSLVGFRVRIIQP